MTIDLNSGSGFVPFNDLPVGHKINALIDAALIAKRRAEPIRNYLGASQLGHECARYLYYDFLGDVPITQKGWQDFWDENVDEPFDGRTLRIFEVGHKFEDLMSGWITAAGFDLITRNSQGNQFGVRDGDIAGHIDGEIIFGPIDLPYPLIWDGKTMKAKKWNEFVKHGLKKSFPVYYTQMNVYCYYRRRSHFILTAINKDTEQLHHEMLPYDPYHTEDMIRRGHWIIESVKRREVPERCARTKDFYICRFCRYADFCWDQPS